MLSMDAGPNWKKRVAEAFRSGRTRTSSSPPDLAAFPLAAIAVAYLVYQAERRPAPREFFKAVLLAMAFLCWAANQFWPSWRQATVLNDIAIALFVFDIFLVMIGWPTTYRDQAFGETCVKTGGSR